MKQKLPSTIPVHLTYLYSFISLNFPLAFYRKLVFVLLLLVSFSAKATVNKYGAAANSTGGVTLLSITGYQPHLTNAKSLLYIVSFSGTLSGLTKDNFLLTTNNITGATITSVNLVPTLGSGSYYNVAIDAGTGDGSLMLSLVNTVGLSVGLNNILPFAGDTYTIDRTAPEAGPLSFSSNNANHALAVTGNTVTLIFGSNEPIKSSVVTIGGKTVTAVSTGTNTYSASRLMLTSDPSERVHFTLTITDLAGNSSSYNDVAAGDDVEYEDNNAYLSDMIINSGITGNPLSKDQEFDPTVQYPTAFVASNVTSISLTPVPQDAGATIKLNDSTMISGSSSAKQKLKSGENVFVVVVTSADGTTTKTYYVTVTRAGPAVATLQGLKVYSGSISPNFNSSITNYTVSVANFIESTAISADPTDVLNATIKVNGNPVTTGYYSNSIPLAEGAATVITTVVTAQDGVTTKTYTVTVNRAPNDNAFMNSITISPGSLSPASGNSYTATVPNDVSSITVTPVAEDPNTTITINGIVVAYGAASTVALSEGDNKISLIATAQDGKTKNPFTITVTRTPMPHNNVSIKMGLSTGSALTYHNSTGTVNYYTASVTPGTHSLTIVPTAADPKATITVDGQPVISGSNSQQITLNSDTTTIIVGVTATDGITKGISRVTVSQNGSSNIGLSMGLSTGSAITYINNTGLINYYTASVAPGTLSLTIVPTAADPNATLTVDGQPVNSGSASQLITLNSDTTTVIVGITAADGVTKRINRVVISQNGSSNIGLSMGLSTGSAITYISNSGVVNYHTASVNSGTPSVMLTPTAADPNATITVDGQPVNSGSTSQLITLNSDTTTIIVGITAADGVTKRINRVTISQNGSSDVDAVMSLSTGSTITYINNTGIVNSYLASVTPGTRSVTMNVVTPSGMVTIDGYRHYGLASQLITLNSDTTTIIVVITAADGITKRVNRVTVSQNGSSNIGLAMSLSNKSAITYNNNSGIVNSYTTSVTHGTASVTLRPTAADPAASITVNGHPVTSGTDSQVISLNSDTTTIIVVITAADGITKRINRVAVSQNGSSNIGLTMSLSTASVITYIRNAGIVNTYISNVADGTPSVTLKPIASDPNATIIVDGQPVLSGANSQPIILNSDSTTIIVAITAADGITRRINRVIVDDVTVISSANHNYAISPFSNPQLTAEEVKVHEALSPNGDGRNDLLIIEGIANYPDNKLTLMDRNGEVIFEVKGYDNTNKVFDGHSNKTGVMQQAGTFFYSLQYKAGDQLKQKTGYIVLKY